MAGNRAKHLFGILDNPSPQTLRLMRGPYSQWELAAKLKMKPQTLAKIEAGKRSPRPITFRRLLEHFVAWTKAYGWPSLDLLTSATNGATKGKQWPPIKSTTAKLATGTKERTKTRSSPDRSPGSPSS